jgi:hypothetical protein
MAPWNKADLGGYIYPAAWQRTTRTSEQMTGAPGNQYCFDVRALTGSGLTSSWSSEECTTLPLGSGSLKETTSGWSRHVSARSYLSSYVETTKKGAELSRTNVEANEIALVVTRCRNCGDVTVYKDGRVLKTVSTYSPRTQYEVVIFLPSFSMQRATLVLKAASKGKRLIVEGLLVT